MAESLTSWPQVAVFGHAGPLLSRFWNSFRNWRQNATQSVSSLSGDGSVTAPTEGFDGTWEIIAFLPPLVSVGLRCDERTMANTRSWGDICRVVIMREEVGQIERQRESRSCHLTPAKELN